MFQKAEFHKKSWGHELWIHNDNLYCGKLLYFEEGKACSLHYHKLKTETFYLESGLMECRFFDIKDVDAELKNVRGLWTVMEPGDVKEIHPGLVHQMRAITGPARLFEFSTQHFDDDSYRLIKGD